MGKVRAIFFKASFVTLAAVFLLLAGYVLLLAVVSWQRGYGWQEMDWNEEGTTSLSEFLSSADVATRQTLRSGQECLEYYALKDGLPVKTVCSSALP